MYNCIKTYNKKYYFPPVRWRSGKNIRISMISNCYTFAGLHQHHNCQYCQILRASSDVTTPSDVTTSSNEWRVFECFKMFLNVLRVIHDVLIVVHDVLLVVHNVLRVFHNVSQCFTSVSWSFTMLTMFYNVQCVTQRSALSHQWSRHHRLPQGLAITQRKRCHAKLHPEWWNSVPGRQFPKGVRSP